MYGILRTDELLRCDRCGHVPSTIYHYGPHRLCPDCAAGATIVFPVLATPEQRLGDLERRVAALEAARAARTAPAADTEQETIHE